MAKKKGKIRKIVFGTIGIIILFVVILYVNLKIVENTASIISKGQPIKSFSERKCALLVIDVQECTTGDASMHTFFKKNSDEMIKNINKIADSFKIQNYPVVYIRFEITNPLVNFLNDSYAEGSPGVKFDKRLKIVSEIEIVKQGKDSFRNTNLDSILVSNKVNELYIVGLDAAECINATVEAAQNRHYRINLIEEAILSKSKETKDSMIVNFRQRGAKVINMDSLKIII